MDNVPEVSSQTLSVKGLNYGTTPFTSYTWDGLVDIDTHPGSEIENNDIKISNGPLTLVTDKNKSALPPEFEVGDLLYSVEVADLKGYKTAIYVSIGKEWIIGEESKNTLHVSFFEGEGSTKIFKQADFNDVVAVPVFKLFQYLHENHGYVGPNIFYLADLPEGIMGRTYFGNRACEDSTNSSKIVINTANFINTNNLKFTFTELQLILQDTSFYTFAHEAFHGSMADSGIPMSSNMRVGAEAFANAFGLDALEIMRYFYKGPSFGDPNSAYSALVRNKATEIFSNHILDMSTTSSYDSGYEHFFLVWYMMQVSNMTWDDIFNELGDYKNHCNSSTQFTPTLFQYVFNHQLTLSDEGPHPFPHTYYAYLGNMLLGIGGYLPEIFDPIRESFETVEKYPLSYGNNIQIAAKNFIPFKVTRTGLASDEYLLLQGDAEIRAILTLSNGQLVVLKPGDLFYDDKSNSTVIFVFNRSGNPQVFHFDRYKLQPLKVVLPVVSKK